MTALSAAIVAQIDNGPAAPAELTIETELIDVTLAVETKPDPQWTYVDLAGHFHAWDKNGDLPTLSTRTQHMPCGDPECCDGYDATYHVCAICEAEIEPATITITHPDRRFEPGQKTWTVVVHAPVLADRVSVRISTERGTMFGIAAVVEREMPRLAGFIARTTLVGVSPLGQRADCT